MTQHYKIVGNSTIYKTKTAIVKDLCVSFNWIDTMIESGKIKVIEVSNKKKPNSRNTNKCQKFYFEENYKPFNTYHCTIDEYVDIRGITKNQMYSRMKAGLLTKSKSKNTYTKSPISSKARKRVLREYVLSCAEKGVPIEINI